MSRKKQIEYIISRFDDLTIKINWDDFDYILVNQFGFKKKNKRGSSRLYTKEGQKFIADEPHNRGDAIVSKDDRRKAIRALKALGLI
jgi:hypothetical protein